VALGGKLLIREHLATPDGEVGYALLEFGGTRLFLTPKTIFEDRLPFALQHGLTHAVFEVAELEPEVERLKALGTEVLIPAMEISAGFGTRRIAFFRSPGGVVFEVMQIISD
jgi:predicted enzyme related to lactoylglutathione lyase